MSKMRWWTRVNAPSSCLQGSDRARSTLFPGVGHGSWSLVDGSGHDAPQEGPPFDQSLYDWLLQFER